MLHKIHLYGNLKDICGVSEPFNINAKSIAEIASALIANFPKIKELLRKGTFKIYSDKREFDTQDINFPLSKKHSNIHIVPVLQGSGGGGGGTAKIVIGALLVVAAVALTVVTLGAAAPAAGAASMSLGAAITSTSVIGVSALSIGLVGVSMLSTGIITALAATPTASSDALQSVDERQSFIFNGPINTTGDGTVVPIIFGRFMVGSIVASAAVCTEEM